MNHFSCTTEAVRDDGGLGTWLGRKGLEIGGLFIAFLGIGLGEDCGCGVSSRACLTLNWAYVSISARLSMGYYVVVWVWGFVQTPFRVFGVLGCSN